MQRKMLSFTWLSAEATQNNRCMKVREFILYAKMADTIYSMSTTNSRVTLHDFKLHLDTQETLLKPIQLKHAVSYRY